MEFRRLSLPALVTLAFVHGCSSSNTSINQVGPIADVGGGGSSSTATRAGGANNSSHVGGNTSVGGTSTAIVGGGSTTTPKTGTTSTGGKAASGGSGGATASLAGGSVATGGSVASGGATPTTSAPTIGGMHSGGVTATGGRGSEVATGGGVTTGGVTASGGAASSSTAVTGGTAATGGAATGGAAAGSKATGGAATGGAATGGAATGGAATGGAATGGAATGGAATGGAGTGGAPINKFVQGPCITTYGSRVPVVYARNAQKTIYERKVNGTAWTALTNNASTVMDARSSVSCASDNSATYISIMKSLNGPAPVWFATGAADGSAVTYGDFADAKIAEGSGFSPAVQSTNGGIAFAAAASKVPAMYVNCLTESCTTPELISIDTSSYTISDLTASPSIAYFSRPTDERLYIVWFDGNGLQFSRAIKGSMGPYNFEGPTGVQPPSTTSFTSGLAPAICSSRPTMDNGNLAVNSNLVIVAVANNQLYWVEANPLVAPSTVGTWARVDSTQVVSSPACSVRYDGTIDIVAIASDGTLRYFSRAPGGSSFTAQNFGGHP